MTRINASRISSHRHSARAATGTIVSALKARPRFAACSTRDLELLARAAHESSVPADWPLIHEFTPSDCCYVILDGEVEVSVERRPVARLGAGSVVGEVGLFNHRLRNATVVSVTPVRVLHLAAEAFHDLVASRPAIRAALCGPAMVRS